MGNLQFYFLGGIINAVEKVHLYKKHKSMRLTALIGVYYCWSYNKDMNPYRGSSPLGTRFFFSGYMFNSLIMLVFSNRFYEHIVSMYVFTFIIGMSVYWKVLNRKFITYIPVE